MWHWLDNRNRISALEEECARLKRRVDEVELDWANYLDKFKRIVNRIAKRAEVVENAERLESNTPDGAEALPTNGSAPLWGRMSPTQRRIQMQILARRQANGG